jgi:hypothetical protein
MKDPGAPKIHELIHYVALCSQKDVVVNASTMELKRTEVVWAWARIRSHYGLPSFIGQVGYSIMDPSTKATHAITVRAGLGLIITNAAYIYETFRKSPPRWYKVLGWSETDDYITMPVRMIEQSDLAIPPHSNLVAQPSPVEL